MCSLPVVDLMTISPVFVSALRPERWSLCRRPPGPKRRVTSTAGQLPTAVRVTCSSSSFVLLVVEDLTVMTSRAPPVSAVTAEEALLTGLFAQEATALVRLARFFVDDRAAAEDLVQEAFIRLARTVHRLRDPAAATAYLRAIVLNL